MCGYVRLVTFCEASRLLVIPDGSAGAHVRPKWSSLVTSRVTAVTSCDILIPQVTVEDLVIYPGDLYFNQFVYLPVGTIELCSFTCWAPEHFAILWLIITNYGTQSPCPQIEYQVQLWCNFSIIQFFCLVDMMWVSGEHFLSHASAHFSKALSCYRPSLCPIKYNISIISTQVLRCTEQASSIHSPTQLSTVVCFRVLPGMLYLQCPSPQQWCVKVS